MPNFFFQELFDFLMDRITAPLYVVLLWAKSLILRVPEVTGQQPVIDLSYRSLQMVQAGYIVLALIAVLLAMGVGGLSGTFSAKDVIQRMVLGFVAAHESAWILRQFTRITNTLIEALAPGGMDALGDLGTSESSVSSLAPVNILLSSLLYGLILFLLLWLVVTWLIRFASLSVAAGLGPLALACHAVPWLDPIAQAWWRNISAVMLTVLGQALTMHLGIQLFLDPGPQAPELKAFDQDDMLIDLLLTVCLLILVLRVPGVVNRALPGPSGGGGGGFGFLGAMVRVVAARHVATAGAALVARRLGLGGADWAMGRRVAGWRRFGMRARSAPDGVRSPSGSPTRGGLAFGSSRRTPSRPNIRRGGRSGGSGETVVATLNGPPGAEAAGAARRTGRGRRRRPVTVEAQIARRARQRKAATKRRNYVRNIETGRRKAQEQRRAKQGKQRPPLTSQSLQAWRDAQRDPGAANGTGEPSRWRRFGFGKPRGDRRARGSASGTQRQPQKGQIPRRRRRRESGGPNS
ncbi:type IV secretion system protein [Kineosporia rhizophila]|uniref:type IV secretion system protein n=1 Tax=Kineosporia TaxID=49184 RepID=UPI001E42D53F|nr:MULTISPECIES: type IV secretion system protein [Kineosporia]MCE0539854.1 type IV secretion system protein [Kineosporia rhizophila]GLY19765.1 hypothetical protein Kisp01_67790 [Kineosporia sp. NBRC 101677]